MTARCTGDNTESSHVLVVVKVANSCAGDSEQSSVTLKHVTVVVCMLVWP